MEKYKFYYDETEHSRKINLSTISQTGYYDNFVTGIIGWNNSMSEQIESRYSAFEDQYAMRKSKGELKSSTLKSKQIKYGFASLNKDNIDFVNDFLDLFDENIMIYFSVTSKIEYLILQLFKNYKSNILIDMEVMKYSIVKSIIQYQPEEVMSAIYTNTSELIEILKKFFKKRIEENRNNLILKNEETKIFEEMILLLDDISENFEIEWDYQIAFDGFERYLAENGIKNYELFIDKEGDLGATINAAKLQGLKNALEIDSQLSIGVRWADMFVGLIAKLLKALHNDLIYTSTAEMTKKKVLNHEWFAINDEQFELYKKLRFVVVELNNSWYKIFSGTYADDLLVLLTFLDVITKFDSINEFKQEIENMPEYVNSACVQRLKTHFDNMQCKLPIKSISKNEKQQEYFLGSRGQKIFFDEAKQPVLEVSDESRMYNVLAVGISKTGTPTVTIEINGLAQCFRIPHELSFWAVSCVSMAYVGENLFPAKVAFFSVENEYFADFIID